MNRGSCWTGSAWNWGLEAAAFYVESLLDHMGQVPDYRCGRKKPHVLREMLTCVVAGFLSGRTSVGRALSWCREHLALLREHMQLEAGIASEPTVSRMLSGIDEELFALCFMEWAAEILEEKGIHIIIDGKALRGGTERIKGGNTPYVLNAIDAATQLVIGQLAIDAKANEITSIPRLLELLDVEGNIFTMDAIGTQEKIEGQILGEGGHFVLQVKRNNPTLYEEIASGIGTFEKELALKPEERDGRLGQYLDVLDRHSSQEKNRERREYREMEVCGDSTFLSFVKDGSMGFIKSVGLSRQVRVPIEKDREGNDITVGKEEFLKNGSVRKPKVSTGDGIKDDVQLVGIISDMELTAKEMAGYKRNHWKIENNLHHVLDDAFREDRSPAKKSKNNLALVRKFAYNILRIYAIREHPEWGIQKLMDYFCDHPELTMKYIFDKIESFY